MRSGCMIREYLRAWPWRRISFLSSYPISIKASRCVCASTWPAVLKLIPVMLKRRPTVLYAEEEKESLETTDAPPAESSRIACNFTKRNQIQLSGTANVGDLCLTSLLGLWA